MAEGNNKHPTPLSEESQQVLAEVFKEFTTSGEDVINTEDLPNALRFAGIMATDSSIQEIAFLFDSNRDGRIQISELVNNWHSLIQHSINAEELLDAFKKFDTNCDGYIRLPEMKRVLMGAGEKWSEAEASQFLEEMMRFDLNGDGKFDYSEFLTMYRANTFPLEKPRVPPLSLSEDFHPAKMGS